MQADRCRVVERGTISWTRSPAVTLMGEVIDKRLPSESVVVVQMPLVREAFVVRSVIVRAGGARPVNGGEGTRRCIKGDLAFFRRKCSQLRA